MFPFLGPTFSQFLSSISDFGTHWQLVYSWCDWVDSLTLTRTVPHLSFKERTTKEALRTSSLNSTTLPQSARMSSSGCMLPPPPPQPALPLEAGGVESGLGSSKGGDVGECIIVDSDDELPGHVQIIARMGTERGSGSDLLSPMVIFKVVHSRPGRLNRPLAAEDDVGAKNSDVFLCFDWHGMGWSQHIQPHSIALSLSILVSQELPYSTGAVGRFGRVFASCDGKSILPSNAQKVRFCSDLFSAADPDTLVRCMTHFRIDASSGKSPPFVVQCKMPALQPLVDAGAFPGWDHDRWWEQWIFKITHCPIRCPAQLDYARLVLLPFEFHVWSPNIHDDLNVKKWDMVGKCRMF